MTSLPPTSTAGRLATAAVLSGGTAAVMHLLPGVVAWRRARCRLLPGLSGVGRPDHVALTFDDGPDPVATPLVLDALDSLGWRATFFFLGSQARREPSLTREVAERGHEIGVHGAEHRSHLLRTAADVTRDVAAARDLLESLTCHPVRWFRPPYGGVAASTLAAARSNDLRLVLWTTWGKDWRRDADGPAVAARVRRTFVPGATVLLHDSDVTSTPDSWKATLDSLPLLAGEWRGQGLDVGPLCEHF